MVKKRVVAEFMKANGYGFFLASIIFILGISWLIPPQENIFVLQRRVQELWIGLVGFLSLPFWLMISDNSILFALFTLAIISLIGGAIIQIALAGGWGRKIILVLLIFVNSIFMILVMGMGFGDGYLADTIPQKECQQLDTSGEGIQLVSYIQTYADGGFTQFFFLSTSDNGETWQQIGSVSYDICRLRQRYGNTNFNFHTCMPEENAHPAWLCLEDQ